jgi:hypothetical protein
MSIMVNPSIWKLLEKELRVRRMIFEILCISASSLTNRRSLAGSGIGGIKETQQMLDFCSKHDIASDIELIPIQGVNEAYPRIVSTVLLLIQNPLTDG